ncbi:MAG: hypothetical protein Q9217_006405 [Psora testacea]
MSERRQRFRERYESVVSRDNEHQHEAARNQTAQRTAEAQRTIERTASNEIPSRGELLQDQTDNLPIELDGQADGTMNRAPSTPFQQLRSRLPPEPSPTPPSSSNGNSGEDDDGTEPRRDGVRLLEARVQQAERRCRHIQRNLELKTQKIAELEGQLQTALDRQVEAIENDALAEAASWERKYEELKRILQRSQEEKRQLQNELRQREDREADLHAQLRIARRELEEQRERANAIGSRLGMGDNDIARSGNVFVQLNGPHERNLERQRNTSPARGPNNAEKQQRGPRERQRRTGEYELITTRDPQRKHSPRHFITRRRSVARRSVFLFGG